MMQGWHHVTRLARLDVCSTGWTRLRQQVEGTGEFYMQGWRHVTRLVRLEGCTGWTRLRQ